jgi:hypothetical protein
MPTPHHLKNLAVPGNRYTLREAAGQGLMLSLYCARCRKPPVLFLASDLIRVLPPSLDCFQPPPFACSNCGTDRHIAVTLRPQEASAVGKLVVRRLAGVRKVPVWRDELLGDSPAMPSPRSDSPPSSHTSGDSAP